MTHSESQFKLNLFGKIANIKDTYHFMWYVLETFGEGKQMTDDL